MKFLHPFTCSCFLSVLGGSVTFLCADITAPQPNPPTAWLTNPTAPASGVYIFNTGSSNIQSTIDTLYETNGNGYESNVSDHGEFSSRRYAIFFQPGDYISLGLNVRVGYYTSVIGLGVAPSDTKLSDVRSLPASNTLSPGSLNTFWRSAENFLTKPTLPWIPGDLHFPGMVWAVSQAAPLRRVIVWGNAWNTDYYGLYLFTLPTPLVAPYNACYASGGFMADCQVLSPDGSTSWKINSGSQRQWFTRNSIMEEWNMGAWNNLLWNAVFVGCEGAPATTDPYSSWKNPSGNPPPPQKGVHPYTTVAATPLISEKPYISYHSGSGHYFLNIPPVETNKTGPTTNFAAATQIDFENVYLVTESNFTGVADINSALANGLHVVFNPGIYALDDTIEVTRDNLCILGLGFATLIAPSNRGYCIHVTGNEGVRIASVLLQANPTTSTDCLLWWDGNNRSGRINPNFLYDCFARVGGPVAAADPSIQVYEMVRINNNHVICDNVWLWRADHDINGSVPDGKNYCDYALEVFGEYVTVYGLACEHTLTSLVRWFGWNGALYFFQGEFPYDASGTPSALSGIHVRGVLNFSAYGTGVYGYFNQRSFSVPCGFLVDSSATGVHFVNAYTRILNEVNDIIGQINHVINNSGDEVGLDSFGPSYLHDWTPASASREVNFSRSLSRERLPQN